MRLAALLIAAVFAFSALWPAGELHRSNCEDRGRVSCSVLPWDGGEVAPQPALTDEQCRSLARARLAAGQDPPDCSDAEAATETQAQCEMRSERAEAIGRPPIDCSGLP